MQDGAIMKTTLRIIISIIFINNTNCIVRDNLLDGRKTMRAMW